MSSLLLLQNLRSYLTQLREEIRICKLLIEQNNRQHRRTLYWKSFLQVVAASKKVEQSLSALVEENVTESKDSAMKSQNSNPSFVVLLQDTAEVCTKSLKRSIALCAARIATPHRGAGFASLASVILASSAKFIDLEYKIRARCLGIQEVEEKAQTRPVVEVEAGIDFFIDGKRTEESEGIVERKRHSNSKLLDSTKRLRSTT